MSAPLHTTDRRTGERDAVYTVDMINEAGQSRRIVDRGRPVREARRVVLTDPINFATRDPIDAEPKELNAPVDIPRPHPAADPERAARLNIQYQEELRRWKALPFLKRLTTKRPDPPTGI